MGEFHLIDRLAGVLGRPKAPGLLLGIGDDAAVWRPTPGTVTVATADALVQGVHFDLATTSWMDLGWKALAENVSDVAAMGCEPRYALVALALPSDVDPADVEALYGGIRECADAYGCAVVGGDVVSAPNVVISVTLIGESRPGETGASDQPPLLTRSAARPGDMLAVTGPLGASAAGLRLLGEGGGEATREPSADLIGAHRRPIPRVAAGRALVQAGVRCAIDVSDGLVADVEHICERSDVDAELDAARVPVHPAAEAIYPGDALELALTGGEDYELVCAGSAANVERASGLLRAKGEPYLTIIGKVLPRRGDRGAVRVLGAEGRALWFGQLGYQHFSTTGTSVPEQLSFETHSEEQTRAFGAELGAAAGADVLLLLGAFGVGKTTLVQGIARGLGVEDIVSSPSFVIANEYVGRLPLYHVDLYRVEQMDQVTLEALAEYFGGHGLCAVEWPASLPPDLVDDAVEIELTVTGEHTRRITLLSPHPAYRLVFERYAARRSAKARP